VQLSVDWYTKENQPRINADENQLKRERLGRKSITHPKSKQVRMAHSFEGRTGADYPSIGTMSNTDRVFICVFLRPSAAKFLPVYQSSVA